MTYPVDNTHYTLILETLDDVMGVTGCAIPVTDPDAALLIGDALIRYHTHFLSDATGDFLRPRLTHEHAGQEHEFIWHDGTDILTATIDDRLSTTTQLPQAAAPSAYRLLFNPRREAGRTSLTLRVPDPGTAVLILAALARLLRYLFGAYAETNRPAILLQDAATGRMEGVMHILDDQLQALRDADAQREAATDATTYAGSRNEDGDWTVTRNHHGQLTPLPLRLDLGNHSPTGFAWGYNGSGPRQLAVALLADVLNDDREAIRLAIPFRLLVIANLEQDAAWRMTGAQIRHIVPTLTSRRTRP